jgi:hypothetical protein
MLAFLVLAPTKLGGGLILSPALGEITASIAIQKNLDEVGRQKNLKMRMCNFEAT